MEQLGYLLSQQKGSFYSQQQNTNFLHFMQSLDVVMGNGKIGNPQEVKRNFDGKISLFYEITQKITYYQFCYIDLGIYKPQMGHCISGNIRKLKDKQPPIPNNQASKCTQFIQAVNTKEKEYLHLIYQDLANRSNNKNLNLYNFSLFFELTGLWGNKLFRHFTTTGKDFITIQQFANGMIKITRAPFEDKVKLLFNFIKNPIDQGIKYDQFVKMLYHYSKKQLKEIMTNDGIFIHEAIIPLTNKLQLEKKNNLKKQNGVVYLQQRPSIDLMQMNGQHHFKKVYQKMFKDYQDPGTLLQFKTEKITYQVSYCNMSSLTKQYASHIFTKYNIHEERQTMNEEQFKNYLEGNMKLFDSYYANFHQNLWGFKSGQPLYISFIEKQTEITLIQNNKSQRGYMMLVLNALIISFNKVRKQQVIRIINLTGAVVSESDSDSDKMVVKDEPEANFTSTIQFSSTQQAQMWLHELKQYSNTYFQNKYQVLQAIGTGKFSIVYKCREKNTGKQYALKIMQLDKLTPKQISTIENETQIMKILKSPSFIKQIEAIFTKKTIYMVTQYIDGQDLYQYIKKRKRLTQTEAAFLLGQIIEAVLHLHNLEIIHRDLKPENIMVVYRRNDRSFSDLEHSKSKLEKIKLIDFGFANYFSVLQEKKDCTFIFTQETPVGTLNYMAPQVLLGQKPTYKNDNFAIGSIMYFMLRGKYPFESTNPQGTAILTVKGEYQLYDSIWEEISQQAKDLVEMLLKADPQERISLKQALDHPWFKMIHQFHSYNI